MHFVTQCAVLFTAGCLSSIAIVLLHVEHEIVTSIELDETSITQLPWCVLSLSMSLCPFHSIHPALVRPPPPCSYAYIKSPL